MMRLRYDKKMKTNKTFDHDLLTFLLKMNLKATPRSCHILKLFI